VTRLRIALAAGAACALVALTGCSSEDPAPPAPSDSPSALSLMPTNNAYLSSLMHTEAMGVSHLDVDLSLTKDGKTVSRSASGSTAMGKGFGELLWTDTKVRERANGQGVYLQDDAPLGPWRQLPKGDTTDTMLLVDALWGLGKATGVTCTALSGIAAHMCTGTVPLDAELLARLGLPKADAQRLSADALGQPLLLTVWTDGQGRITQVRRHAQIAAASGSVEVDVTAKLSDFITPIHIDVPTLAPTTS
jgi:hypothetical protein